MFEQDSIDSMTSYEVHFIFFITDGFGRGVPLLHLENETRCLT